MNCLLIKMRYAILYLQDRSIMHIEIMRMQGGKYYVMP